MQFMSTQPFKHCYWNKRAIVPSGKESSNNRDVLKNYYPMPLASKKEITEYGISLMNRLFPRDSNSNKTRETSSSSSTTAAEEIQSTSKGASLHERMLSSIKSINPGNNEAQPQSTAEKIFRDYHISGKRCGLLNKFLDALSTAQPTSTQSERNFSLAASISTKKRLKMKCEKLDAICFLKGYFKRKNEILKSQSQSN